MKFLFEDSENQALSKLIQYELKNYGNLFFANGNNNLELRIKELYEGDEPLVVFIDVPFNNPDTVDIYKELAKAINNDKMVDVYLIPIICAEYVFLEAFQDCPLFRINFPGASSILKEAILRGSPGSFERECIYMLKEYPHNCAKVIKGSIRDFYIKDCLCEYPRVGCKTIALQDKSKRYLRNFPVLRVLLRKGEITKAELLLEHRGAVDYCNVLISAYRQIHNPGQSSELLQYVEPCWETLLGNGRTSAFNNL